MAIPSAKAQVKLSMRLQDRLDGVTKSETPTFVFAQEGEGEVGGEIRLKGEPQLRRMGLMARAEHLSYDTSSDLAKAEDNVFLNINGNRYWGDSLEIETGPVTGFFIHPHYKFLKNNAGGAADRIDFLNEKQSIAKNVTFSACRAPEFGEDGKPWKPDWVLHADSIQFDLDEDVARAKGATLSFKGIPLLPVPAFAFPLSDRRKSGFLPLTLVSDSRNGYQVIEPYYWNIAPNRDATLSSSLSAKRGVGVGAELRYLEPRFSGQTQLDVLPDDRLFGKTRWGLNSDQSGRIDASNTWRLQLNRVSDDDYWKDFPNLNKALTQRLLQNDFSLNNLSNGWSTTVRAQRWQTLQDLSTPITPPFDRAPQISSRKSFLLTGGFQAQMDGDFSAFSSARPDLTGQPNAKRGFVLAQVSRPFVATYGFLTPKLSVHASSYRFDVPYVSSDGSVSNTSEQRLVPTLSLDSGLTFERSTQLFGSALQQTLEPRAYFVRTPFRDQSNLPNYDSALKEFSMASLFSDNRYVGHDRVADASLLTLGVTTRFLNPLTGAELLRAGIAQQHSFMDARVTLPGVALPTQRTSDWLLSATATLSPKWAVDSTVQFGQMSHVSERTTVTGRYNPTSYRNLYMAYRMQKDTSEQVDVGWQWPIGDLWHQADEPRAFGQGLGPNRWYSVARTNYSMRDQRMISALAGLEYDADCWIGRVVIEQTQLDVSNASRRIMFQIEFNGFTRVGISPLASLRSYIPRYQSLREQTTSPSRFSQYD